MSDVLTDPDFVDTTPVCVRQVQTVNAHGRGVNAPTSIPFAGVITADRGAILNRVAEGSYVAGSILIYTMFALRMAGAGVDADLVNWHGGQFTAVNVGDYTGFGSGFVWAVCEPLKLAG